MPALPAPQIAVLLNPAAGSASGDLAQQIADRFSARGFSPSQRFVHADALAEATRQALQEGATVIAAGGGDGTISTVASVLAGGPAALGVLPLGTLNHFAKDLHIPLQIEQAVDTIADGHTISVDVGEVNDRTFINNSSLGVYPSIVSAREREQQQGYGKLVSLALALIQVWKRDPQIVVTLRSESGARTVRTPFVFVGNGEYDLAGIDLTRRQSLTGGRLHVCLAPNISRFEGVRMVAAALVGRLHQIDAFEAFFDTDLVVDAPRTVAGSVDGEVTVLQSPLRYRIRPKALRVIVPADAGGS